jgi:hypothetical protein
MDRRRGRRRRRTTSLHAAEAHHEKWRETRHSPDVFSSPSATALHSLSLLLRLVVRPLFIFGLVILDSTSSRILDGCEQPSPLVLDLT